MTRFSRLMAVSPIDGRYGDKTEVLQDSLSEFGLIKRRVFVELHYLRALSDEENIPFTLSPEALAFMETLEKLTPQHAEVIKQIETAGIGHIKKTNHDVKAVELYLAERFIQAGHERVVPWIHSLLTSEDVNSPAYALMLSDALEECVAERLTEVESRIQALALGTRLIPMLSRTHGQPATPTTLGKEFAVFSSRLRRQLAQFESFKMLVKFGGASGNMNAHRAAYPTVDWPAFARRFIERLSPIGIGRIRLAWNPMTTQIEPHDTFAELFAILMRSNTILIDFCQDTWRYISDEWMVQKPSGVGSSAMPHKVNPIDFENAEGNLGYANANFEFFCRKLPVSRLQRDLSDSTVIRYFGVALGASLVAYKAILRGLDKISPSETKIAAALAAHPEILAEAYQTILRREGHADAYMRLMAATQGKAVSLSGLHEFVNALEVGQAVKDELLRLTPESYTGYAPSLMAAS